MQLTKHTDYAFRILLFLLALPKGQKTTIGAIVDRYDISKSHVMKIVNKLAEAGFIDAKRGKSGGISLGKPPEKIMLDEIVRLMEVNLKPVKCQEMVCVLQSNCKLEKHLQVAANAFITSLSKVSLEDLTSKSTMEILRV